MDKSEDFKKECLEYPEYQKEKEKEDEITNHKTHTFKRAIPTGN